MNDKIPTRKSTSTKKEGMKMKEEGEKAML